MLDAELRADRRAAPAGADERGRARVLDVTFGVTSMTAPLRRVLVRRPATAGDWDGAGWRVPDPAALARQHEAFCELLAGLGAEVEVARRARRARSTPSTCTTR